MTRWIGAVVLAACLTCSGAIAVNPAVAAQNPGAPKAAGPTARRGSSHHARFASRPPARPVYYDRPDDYRPYPYALPTPFFLGLGFEPW